MAREFFLRRWDAISGRLEPKAWEVASLSCLSLSWPFPLKGSQIICSAPGVCLELTQFESQEVI